MIKWHRLISSSSSSLCVPQLEPRRGRGMEGERGGVTILVGFFVTIFYPTWEVVAFHYHWCFLSSDSNIIPLSPPPHPPSCPQRHLGTWCQASNWSGVLRSVGQRALTTCPLTSALSPPPGCPSQPRTSSECWCSVSLTSSFVDFVIHWTCEGWGAGVGGVCWLLNVSATCECISDGSAQTILRAATLR